MDLSPGKVHLVGVAGVLLLGTICLVRFARKNFLKLVLKKWFAGSVYWIRSPKSGLLGKVCSTVFLWWVLLGLDCWEWVWFISLHVLVCYLSFTGSGLLGLVYWVSFMQ